MRLFLRFIYFIQNNDKKLLKKLIFLKVFIYELNSFCVYFFYIKNQIADNLIYWEVINTRGKQNWVSNPVERVLDFSDQPKLNPYSTQFK